MKAGIAIDKYKLDCFTKHLIEAGFKFEQHPGITSDTYTLTVYYTQQTFLRLRDTIAKANKESSRLVN